jgi:hypothetical protein
MAEELSIDVIPDDEEGLEAEVEDSRGRTWRVAIMPRGERIDPSTDRFVQHWEATINRWRPRFPGLIGSDRRRVWEEALRLIRSPDET